MPRNHLFIFYSSSVYLSAALEEATACIETSMRIQKGNPKNERVREREKGLRTSKSSSLWKTIQIFAFHVVR